MAFLFKDTFDPIHLKLTSGTKISLTPSICNGEIMVMAYTSTDIDVSFILKANEHNYNVVANLIEMGRYSQALHYAARTMATEYHHSVITQAANLNLIA